MNDEIKTTLAHPAVQEGWCKDCSPDNCVGCATPAAPVDADVQKQDEALIWLMLAALEVTASDVCQVAHHKKRDQHGHGDVCPVQARHDEAIAAGRARLEGKP